MKQVCKSTDANEALNTSKVKYYKDWQLELLALIGFCTSGAIFIVSGIQNGDVLTIFGSAVWILSCLIWMFTYRKYFTSSKK